MKIVYIAAPYRAASHNDVHRNIQWARTLAEHVWKHRAVAVCPHLNSAFMSGCVPEELFLEGYLKLVERCDGLVMHSGAEISEGVKAEIEWAKKNLLPVFDIEAHDGRAKFREWVRG